LNIKKKYLISTIILWILVICLLIIPLKESIVSFYNGTNIALEGVEIIYGMKAFFSTLSLYISFYFPIFIIGIILLLISIILTTMTIIKYKNKI
jgi:hypothetical protein